MKRKIDSAFDDFKKNVYHLILKDATGFKDNLHLCLMCAPNGTINAENEKNMIKVPTGKNKKGEVTFPNGYTNVYHHFDHQHPNWRKLVEEAYGNHATQLTLDDFQSKDGLVTFEWMELIIENNLPLTHVEKKSFTKKINIKGSLCYKTLVKRMELVMEFVKDDLKSKLRGVKSFGLMIDGWSHNHSHFLAVFIVTKEYGNFLLYFSPLIDETRLTAASMADTIETVLEDYGLPHEKFVFLVGDNTNVNPALAKELNVYFIGCHSHTLNLAIQKKLFANDSVKKLINKVHRMMNKLLTTKRLAILRTRTHLTPKIKNVTRWTSTFEMIERYLEIHAVVDELFKYDSSVDRVVDDTPDDHYSKHKMYSLIPTPDEHDEIKEIAKIIQPFAEATENLQSMYLSPNK